MNSFSLGEVLQWATNLWDKVFKHFHVSLLDFNMQQAKSELFSPWHRWNIGVNYLAFSKKHQLCLLFYRKHSLSSTNLHFFILLLVIYNLLNNSHTYTYSLTFHCSLKPEILNRASRLYAICPTSPTPFLPLPSFCVLRGQGPPYSFPYVHTHSYWICFLHPFNSPHPTGHTEDGGLNHCPELLLMSGSVPRPTYEFWGFCWRQALYLDPHVSFEHG